MVIEKKEETVEPVQPATKLAEPSMAVREHAEDASGHYENDECEESDAEIEGEESDEEESDKESEDSDEEGDESDEEGEDSDEEGSEVEDVAHDAAQEEDEKGHAAQVEADTCILVELPVAVDDTPIGCIPPLSQAKLGVDALCEAYTCSQLREECKRRGMVVRAKDGKKILAGRLANDCT